MGKGKGLGESEPDAEGLHEAEVTGKAMISSCRTVVGRAETESKCVGLVELLGRARRKVLQRRGGTQWLFQREIEISRKTCWGFWIEALKTFET